MEENNLAFANRNILYVDDEPVNLRVFKATFDWEYTVYTAESGAEALKMLEKLEIQVIVSDYKMPDMDGLMLLERVSLKYPEIIRIILSGYAETSIILEAVNRIGIYRFIPKPFEENQLKESLNNALDLYRLKKEKSFLVDELEDQITNLEAKVQKRTEAIQLQKRLLEEEIHKAALSSEKLDRAFNIIRNKNKEILDSISYAKTIQHAILHNKKELSNLSGHLVLYLPRDIVSGDFYWAAQMSKTESWFAMVDCSGHGVPGAFMSMIGHTLLNKLVREKKLSSPAEVLAELHQEIRSLLNQDQIGSSVNDDGMDLALLQFEQQADKKMKVTYAAAKRPLLYFSGGEKVILKGSRRSIGGRFYQNFETANQSVILDYGDVLYVWTDGITDQHNEHYKKIGTRRLINFIEELNSEPLPLQLQKLEDWLLNYKAQTVQRDDIALAALKI